MIVFLENLRNNLIKSEALFISFHKLAGSLQCLISEKEFLEFSEFKGNFLQLKEFAKRTKNEWLYDSLINVMIDFNF